MKYFVFSGNEHSTRSSCRNNVFTKHHVNPLNVDELPAVSMQDRIKLAFDLGVDTGSRISPVFDEEDNDSIDITTDFHHDQFSIAERFGVGIDNQPASTSVPISSADDN